MGEENGARTAIREWVVLLVLPLLLLSCSDSSNDDDDGAGFPAGRAPVASVEDAAPGRLPIEAALYPGDEGVRQLAAAQTQLVTECMEDRGFEFSVPEPNQDPISPVDPAQRYGHITVADAEQFGYHNPRAALVAADIEQQQQEGTSARPAGFVDALMGEPVQAEDGSVAPDGTGCMAIAATAIYGNQLGVEGFEEYEVLLQVQIDSLPRTTEDPEIEAAESAWSDCMLGRGFRYTTSSGPRAEFQVPPESTEPPSDAERATAVADAECREEVGLLDLYLEVESRIQSGLLQGKEEAFNQMRSDIESALRRAGEILAG